MNDPVEKIDIAIEYIDLSIEQVMGRRNYYCALHLAGAANELIEKYIAKIDAHNRQAHHDQMLDALEKLSNLPGYEFDFERRKESQNIRDPINAIKHMDLNRDNHDKVHFNAKERAIEEIENTLYNFKVLMSLNFGNHKERRGFTNKMLRWFDFMNANL